MRANLPIVSYRSSGRLPTRIVVRLWPSADITERALVLAASANVRKGLSTVTNPDDEMPPAVGACWIKVEDYAALRTIFDDGDRLPSTWQEWLKVAMEMEQGLKAYGHVVLRVYIDPTTFPDWCAANGTTPGREGRKRFVAAAVAERYGEQT